MGTIITVHGTFASGPPEGQIWWQRQSPFATRMETLLQGTDGSVTIEPFIWDGFNSEASRRAAGARLADRLEALESAGEPYAVVGHSHGGSVISAALLKSARSENPLRGLQRWITIGTPFIKTERQPFLFLRLGIFGKAIYLTLLTFSVLVALSVFVGASTREWPEWIIAVLCAVGPMAVFIGVMRYREYRDLAVGHTRPTAFAASTFADRWFSLWHAKDEAVQCLKAVKGLDVEIFSRDFAATALNLLAVAIIPLAVLFVLTSEPIMDVLAGQVFSRIEAVAADDLYTAGGNNIFENAAVAFIWLLVVPASLVLPAGSFDKLSDLAALGLLIVAVGILLSFAVALTSIFTQLARIASNGLSRVLNPMTLAQLKASAYGSDLQADMAVDATDWPIWLDRGYPPITGPLADDLEHASDQAIALVIPKFRNIVDSLTATETKDAAADVLADYLTWHELIHTSYFNQDRFAKLLAYTLGQTDGFRVTDAFRHEPDFGLIAETYGMIAEGAVGSRGSVTVRR